VKQKPNGVGPADPKTVGPAAVPSSPTTYIDSRLVARSVTTSTSPPALNCTCAALAAGD
jgi:hypothetical protein